MSLFARGCGAATRETGTERTIGLTNFYFTEKDVERLEEQAVQLRRDIVEMIHAAKAGHPGGSLSAVDMITALYFHVMRIDPQNPRWEDRDRFVLSKGHACPALYAALARRGFFDPKHLTTLRQYHSILQGHPDMNKTPGIDISSGSLGNGLAIGVGMAMSGRLHHQDYMTYVMLGDGEVQEGMVWEAAMAAHHHDLGNLVAIVDCNGVQINGWVNEIMTVEPARGQVARLWLERCGGQRAQHERPPHGAAYGKDHAPPDGDPDAHGQRKKAFRSWRTTANGTAIRQATKNWFRRSLRLGKAVWFNE